VLVLTCLFASYEVQSLDGNVLAGKVAAYFSDPDVEPVVVLAKAIALDF
jgi:hypothetical protein